FQDPQPALFSFNSPAGACPRCQGFGNTIDYDMDLAIPDKGLSLDEGAIEPWTKPRGSEWWTGFKKNSKGKVRVLLSRYRGYARCPECHGARLRKEALWVRVGEKTIGDAVRLNIAEAGQ